MMINLIRLIWYVLTQAYIYIPTAVLRHVHWPIFTQHPYTYNNIYNCITILSESICRFYAGIVFIFLITDYKCVPYNYRQLILYLPHMHLYYIVHSNFYLSTHGNPLTTCAVPYIEGVSEAHIGSTVQLTCHHEEALHVYWVTPDGRVVPGINPLIIRNSTYSDSGAYKCVVVKNSQENLTDSHQLLIYGELVYRTHSPPHTIFHPCSRVCSDVDKTNNSVVLVLAQDWERNALKLYRQNPIPSLYIPTVVLRHVH